VTATANRYLEPQRTREADRIGNVGDTGTSGNQSRTFIDQTVVDTSGFLISRIRRLQKYPRKHAGEVRDPFGHR
jgi:hypothetical protein